MKKVLIIFILLSISFLSCKKTKEQNYTSQFKAKYIEKMNDPSSFEFVSITILSGLLVHKENMSFIKESNLLELDEKSQDSLINERLKNQESVIFEIRAKNLFGAKKLSVVNAYFVDGNLKYIDGEKVY